jgi:hypothetical protein
MAVLIASVTMLVAPLAEPARPARSRTPASTGAAVSVLMVTARGDKPRRRTFLPAIFVWPNDAPCLALPYTGRNSESMSRYARSAMPDSSVGVRAANPTRDRRSTAASWRTWPWVNSRRKIPNVAQAYTPPKSFFIPPDRTTSRSSMLSAPAASPATTDISFAVGLAAPDLTRSLVNRTCSSSNRDRPACSANSSNGTRPTCDTRLSSSNTALSPRQA